MSPRPTVLLPDSVIRNQLTGLLFGYAHTDTGIHNIISCGQPPIRPQSFASYVEVGRLFEKKPTDQEMNGLVGWYSNDGSDITFALNGTRCDRQVYSLVRDVFSRNSGITESSLLSKSCAVISGCGSVGSFVALELARAGVGRFLLVDNDILAYHNLCRHQCGITDVGRFKTDSLRDRIHDINPAASICCRTEILEAVPKEVFDQWCDASAVIIGCADNREGDIYANKISCLYSRPFVSIGLWERAFAGELFWSIPGKTACYYCGFGGRAQNDLSNRSSTNRRLYTNESDLQLVNFEPGISMDINFVSLIGAKLALDLIQLQVDPTTRPRTLKNLTQFTLVCNSQEPGIGGPLSELFSEPLQITRSITVEQLAGCPHCLLVSQEGVVA